MLDTATGRISGASQTGTFKTTRVSGEQSPALQSGNGDALAAAAKSFTEVSGWVTKAADMVPADKYAYGPATSVRTFGQLIAHVADAYNYYCGQAAGRNVQWSDAAEKGNLDKTALS